MSPKRKRHSPLTNQHGGALLLVLIMLVIFGLSLGMTGALTSTLMQQLKEEELLFRGDQYRKAIESYFKSAQGNPQQQQQPSFNLPIGAAPGGGMYPASLDDLVKDNRSAGTVRHLRRKYTDPFTGDEFVLIKAPGGRIKGVRSASPLTPFKEDNFLPAYENFKGAKSYQEWEFVFETGQKGSVNTTGETKIQGIPQ
ncbi:MAG: type II secretion system protein [Desulfuromonadales bacterium]|nr:type II secretion system protein [Desulfuromonadales bacterium]